MQLNYQGYDITPYHEFSIEEINAMFLNKQLNMALSSNKNKKTYVIYHIEKTLRKENIDEYFAREVLPFAENSWYDDKKMKIGYEIPFNKYFYEYEALRPLNEIAKDIFSLENETENLLKEIVE